MAKRFKDYFTEAGYKKTASAWIGDTFTRGDLKAVISNNMCMMSIGNNARVFFREDVEKFGLSEMESMVRDMPQTDRKVCAYKVRR